MTNITNYPDFVSATTKDGSLDPTVAIDFVDEFVDQTAAAKFVSAAGATAAAKFVSAACELAHEITKKDFILANRFLIELNKILFYK